MKTFEDIKLKYELLRLENIILKDLSCLIEHGCEPDEWLIADFKSALKEEIEKVKHNLKHSMLHFNRKYARQTYIQYHQQTLIQLAASLVNYANPQHLKVVSDSPSVQQLTYLLYWSLEDLLLFIESHFSRYFDPEAWIPPRYLRILLHDVTSTIEETSKRLIALGIDRDLFNAAIQPLRKFIDEHLTTDVTYRQMRYLKQLNNELSYLSRHCTALDVNTMVNTALHELNFNSQNYINYCIRYMQNELKEAEDSVDDQIFMIAKFSKYVNQVQVRPGFVFDVNMPPLAELLADWIEIEADFIKTGLHQAADDAAEPPKGMSSTFKVVVDLTIAQLSYLISVLLAVNVIQNKNKSALSRFITAFFATRHTSGMAKGSMRKKLYAKDDNVRESVKKILERCLRYIERDTGEFARK